jgi:Fe2+ or Zn2+ uptake regulation protein
VRVDPNVEHAHHHLICTSCGKVRDVLVDVGTLRVSARERRGFRVADVEVHFRGVCDECAPGMSKPKFSNQGTDKESKEH